MTLCGCGGFCVLIEGSLQLVPPEGKVVYLETVDLLECLNCGLIRPTHATRQRCVSELGLPSGDPAVVKTKAFYIRHPQKNVLTEERESA